MAKKIVGEDGKVYYERKPIYKKWWFILLVVLIVLGAIGNLGKKDNSSVSTEEKKVETNKVEEKKEDANIPGEYKSALKKAEVYSNTMSMSKASIYEQLVSEFGEKFPKEAAQYAVDNLKANYNENALKKAETYSSSMNMSKASIYDQLTSSAGEKFTKEEAQYAVDNLK